MGTQENIKLSIQDSAFEGRAICNSDLYSLENILYTMRDCNCCTGQRFSRPPFGDIDATNAIIVRSVDSYPDRAYFSYNFFWHVNRKLGISNNFFLLSTQACRDMFIQKPENVVSCLQWVRIFLYKMPNLETLYLFGNLVVDKMLNQHIDLKKEGTCVGSTTINDRKVGIKVYQAYNYWRK